MSQITQGIRSILSHPKVYDAFQDLMGAKSVRDELVANHLSFANEFSLLDIGCGTARLLDALPSGVDYFGFDMSQRYIDYARNTFGDRAQFECMLVDDDVVEALPEVDVVVAAGVLHHLDDRESKELFKLAYSALKPGGILLTIDPCIEQGQSKIARFLIDRDRGQNVRTSNEYHALASDLFRRIEVEIKHRTWIPYTNCVLCCEK